MKEFFITFYGYAIFIYSIAIIVSYVILIWLAEISIRRSRASFVESYAKKIVDKSPYTPGVSIVAPAYNEERTIVDNVNSLLAQNYPKFEVVIVNDGSKDSTLEKLIEISSWSKSRSTMWNLSRPGHSSGCSDPRTPVSGN